MIQSSKCVVLGRLLFSTEQQNKQELLSSGALLSVIGVSVSLPAADPPDQQRIVNHKLDHRIQLLLSFVQQIVQLLESNREGVRSETPFGTKR